MLKSGSLVSLLERDAMPRRLARKQDDQAMADAIETTRQRISGAFRGVEKIPAKVKAG